MTKPLAIDLFCGLGGWTDGLLAEGWDVIGFDLERHEYGKHRYPAQLVIQDVLTLHGSQFRCADLIVASPPCQEFSYMAMPWSKAKAKAMAIRADTSGKMLADLTRLFDACFRLQAQASLAAGRHIPLVVENVRGAQPWVGRARWMFGSFALWGDVPALMPIAKSFKSKGLDWNDRTKPCDFTRIAGEQALGTKHDNSGGRENGTLISSQRMVRSVSSTADMRRALCYDDGIKQGGTWFHDNQSISRQSSSKSPRRKMASAMIAKIPLPLSRHVAAVYRP